MVSFIALISLYTAVTCAKHQKLAALHLRHRSSNRGDHNLENDRSSTNALRNLNLGGYSYPGGKNDMIYELPGNRGKHTENLYPHGDQSISDVLFNNKIESYSNYKPREIDALTDAYGYSWNPFKVAPSYLPNQNKDRASNPIFPIDKKPSEQSNYWQNVALDHTPSSDLNRNIPIEMTYMPFEEPYLNNTTKVVPQWSFFPEKVEYVIGVIKKNLEMTSPSKKKLQFGVMKQYPPWIHYTLLVTVCMELVNDVFSKGEDAYERDFDQTIIETVNKVTANPQEAAETIKFKLDKIFEFIAPILRYINNVMQSEVCFLSVECDTMIEHALTQTTNLRLKLQAILLQAAINLADIFMVQHAEAFELAAKEHRGFEYVFNVDSRELAPLVAAGYTVKMIRKYLNPTVISTPFKW